MICEGLSIAWPNLFAIAEAPMLHRLDYLLLSYIASPGLVCYRAGYFENGVARPRREGKPLHGVPEGMRGIGLEAAIPFDPAGPEARIERLQARSSGRIKVAAVPLGLNT